MLIEQIIERAWAPWNALQLATCLLATCALQLVISTTRQTFLRKIFEWIIYC